MITDDINGENDCFAFVSGLEHERPESIAFTKLAVAKTCMQIQTKTSGVYSDHLRSLGFVTNAAGWTVLNALEEAYHCYQSRNNLDGFTPGLVGILTGDDRNHPLELAIPPVIQKFIESGKFKYPLYDVQTGELVNQGSKS